MTFSVRELIGEAGDDFEGLPSLEECGWNLDQGSILEARISALSSHGDGLAVSPSGNWVLVVPFCVPGDVAKARVYRHELAGRHSFADLVEVVEKGEWRNDDLVQCKYFGQCASARVRMPHKIS